MLKNISPLISPEMLKIMSEMGHGDEIIFTDAHYPAYSMNVANVLRADGIGVVDLLEAVLPLFEIDSYVPDAAVMMSAVAGDSLNFELIKQCMRPLKKYAPHIKDITFIERFSFYERAQKAYAIVVTGETGKYGNIILKKGVTPLA